MQEIRPDKSDLKSIKDKQEEAELTAELEAEELSNEKKKEVVVKERKARDKRTPEKKIRK